MSKWFHQCNCLESLVALSTKMPTKQELSRGCTITYREVKINDDERCAHCGYYARAVERGRARPQLLPRQRKPSARELNEHGKKDIRKYYKYALKGNKRAQRKKEYGVGTR